MNQETFLQAPRPVIFPFYHAPLGNSWGQLQLYHFTVLGLQTDLWQFLLLGCFSHVQLCVTPQTAAHQALPSLGFSRQEHWSGLPFPSPMHESESEIAESCLTLLDPMDYSLPGSSIHGIFQARVLEWGAAAKSLQSCPTLCDPIDGSPPGSPVPGILQARTLEWVAISFSNAWK